MTKDNKKLIENIINIVLIAIIVFILIYVSSKSTYTQNKKIEECYNIVGKENITAEYWEDWYHHAYVNNTLVCAHGYINKNGLKEIVDYFPPAKIKIVNLT